MYRTRPGVLPVRNLGAMLREMHEDAREVREAEIKRREEADAGVVDEATGEKLEPLGEYAGDTELDSIDVRVRLLSKAAYMEFLETMTADQTRTRLRGIQFCRDFVRLAVAEIYGLEDDQGAYSLGGDDGLSDEDIDAIDAFDLLGDLYSVAKHMQDLPGKRVRHYGLRAP